MRRGRHPAHSSSLALAFPVRCGRRPFSWRKTLPGAANFFVRGDYSSAPCGAAAGVGSFVNIQRKNGKSFRALACAAGTTSRLHFRYARRAGDVHEKMRDRGTRRRGDGEMRGMRKVTGYRLQFLPTLCVGERTVGRSASRRAAEVPKPRSHAAPGNEALLTPVS